MTIPNFCKFDIYSNGVKIGDTTAPCKKIAIWGLKSNNIYYMFPNIKLKLKKINLFGCD